MFGLLVFLFTVVPTVELYLLFKIGGQIGGLNTLMIVLFTGVLGASLARSQGLSILHKIQNDMNQGALPANQIIHGLMVFAGGLLLLTPGFMTDIVGFSLVMPGPRHILIIWVKKMLERAMKEGNLQFGSFGSKGSQGFYSYTSHENQENSFNQFERQLERHSAESDSQLEGDVIEAEFTEKD